MKRGESHRCYFQMAFFQQWKYNREKHCVESWGSGGSRKKDRIRPGSSVLLSGEQKPDGGGRSQRYGRRPPQGIRSSALRGNL